MRDRFDARSSACRRRATAPAWCGAALRAKRCAAGFTLTEILVALAILGGATVVIMGNVATAIRMYRQSREMVAATSLARARLDTLVAQTERLKTASEEGPEPSEPRFYYAVTLEQVPIPGIEAPDIKALYRATVVESWGGDGGAARQVRLVRYMADESGTGKPWRGNIEGL